MMKPLAVAALVALPTLAHAQSPDVIVVTPNPPTVIVNGQEVAPVVAPGAAEEPPAYPQYPQYPQYPPPQYPQNGAPQNENWNDVSHINGTVIPVGDRNQYLYKFKKTNISTNPIGLMLGMYDLSVQHAVSQYVTIRGDISTIQFDYVQGMELGVSLPIYFRRAYSGPFFEPGLLYHSWQSYSDNDCFDCSASVSTSSDTWVGPQMLFGWSWIFDSGLNVSAAFGAARPMSKEKMSEYGNDDEPYPVGYFRVGYAF